MKIDWNKRYTTIAIYAIIVFLICYFIVNAASKWDLTLGHIKGMLRTLSPFIYALAIAYFIDPLVTKLEKYLFKKVVKDKTRRAFSIIVAYLIVLGFIVLLLSFVIPQIIDSIQEIAKLPIFDLAYIQLVMDKGSIAIFDTGYSIDLSLVNEYLNENVLSTFSTLSGFLTNFAPIIVGNLASFTAGLFNLIIGFIIAIYLLMSKESALHTARKVVFAIFPPKKSIFIINLSKESNTIFINFILGKLLDSLIIGIIAFISLLLLKYPFALLLSVIVGITNIIPFFGPFVGGGIGFVILLFINPVQALWYLLFIFILQQFDGNILGPKILGDSTGLSAFWVIFAIIFFGKFFGIVGMFIGVPITAVIKNIIKREIDLLYSKRMRSM
jgi:predicted PurR-regulated permease PerM